jgi:microcystin-dependent protein
MAFVAPKDRVLERSTSNSQTVFTVTGAADTSYNAFSASMSVGDTTIGGVVEAGTAFKSGVLTYSASGEVTVTTVYESKGTFSAGGVKEVFMGLPASRAPVSDVGKVEFWPTSDVPASRLKGNGGSYLRATYPDLAAFLIKTGAATFTSGLSNVGMAAHGRSVGDPIKLFTTGALPTGTPGNFSAGTHGLATAGANYFVHSIIDANTLRLTATPGGTAITATSAGSGTHSWVSAPHGDGDGSTTFTVPEYRGEFLRAWDNGRGIDVNRAIGDLQLDAFQGHFHSLTRNTTPTNYDENAGTNTAATVNARIQGTQAVGSPTTDSSNGTPRTAAETRPRNVSALVTIRYAA